MPKKVSAKKQTVRERASATGQEPKAKRRVIRSTASKISPIFKVFKPLSKPFQVKPIKKVLHVAGLVLWPKFLREAFKELKQVTWPGRKETLKLTMAVFVFAVAFGIMIAIADYGLDRVFKKLLL